MGPAARESVEQGLATEQQVAREHKVAREQKLAREQKVARAMGLTREQINTTLVLDRSAVGLANNFLEGQISLKSLLPGAFVTLFVVIS